MRPLYESARNLAAERALAERVAEAWGVRSVKLKAAYPLDYALVEERRVRALVECKCRTYSMARMDSYGGFMLSLHKWADMKRMSEASGLPVLIVIEDGDGSIWWHKPVDFSHDGVAFGGRTDRQDAQDVEPVILLRATRFTSLPCRRLSQAA